MKCTCGRRMICIDSRPTGERLTRRRYRCSCGNRQSSIEMPVDDTGPGVPMIGSVMGHNVLKRIIAICNDGEGDPATLKLKRMLAAALTPALSIPVPAKTPQEADDLL